MRDESVTIAKSIAIMMMVLVHTQFSVYGSLFVNMFHMPLFFFFSGYCFKDKYLTDFRGYAKRRIDGIYKPFVKWSLIFLLFHNVLFYLNIYNDKFVYAGKVSHIYSYSEFVVNGFRIVTSLFGSEQLLGGYWFLHALFFASLFFYAIVRISHKYIGGGILLLTFSSLIFVSKEFMIPYWHIDGKVLLATIFMFAGYEYKKSGMAIENQCWAIPIGFLLVYAGTKYWCCNMLSLTWQKEIPYIISAISGTIMVFSVSRIVVKMNIARRMLVYIGDNTLEILTWHFLCFKVVSLMIVKYYNLPMTSLAEFPTITTYTIEGWWIAYFFTGIAVPMAGCWIMDKIKGKII